MKTSIDGLKIYAIEDKMEYQVSEIETFDNRQYAVVKLKLTRGWDYVNPDENDVQGWVDASNFNDDLQTEEICWRFLESSLVDELTGFGYDVKEA